MVPYKFLKCLFYICEICHWYFNRDCIASTGEVVEKREATLVGMQTDAATMENSMEFPQKTKNGTAF